MRCLALAHVAVAALVLCGCASTGVKTTQPNNRIEMPYYSLVVPPDRDWRVDVEGGPFQLVVVTKEHGERYCRMEFRLNVVLDESLRAVSAYEAAAAILRIARDEMIEQGEKTGLFKLDTSYVAETTHGGKEFHKMEYLLDHEWDLTLGKLLVYLPTEAGNDIFMVASYETTVPRTNTTVDTHVSDFHQALSTLEMRIGG